MSLAEFVGRVMQVRNNLRNVAREPVSQQAHAQIRSLLVSSARARASAGVAPDGTPFAPLSPGYAGLKRRRGVAQEFWIGAGSKRRGGGESLRKIDAESLPGNRVRVWINTPYSKIPHDGAEYTVQTGHKRPKQAAAAKARHTKSLISRYGLSKGQGSLARQYHEGFKALSRAVGDSLLSEEHRARIGAGVKRAAANGKRQRTGRVVIPARPILGVSREDAANIRKILVEDLRRRLIDA